MQVAPHPLVQVFATEAHVMLEGSGTTVSCQETVQVQSALPTRRLKLVDCATHLDVGAAEGLLRNMATIVGHPLVPRFHERFVNNNGRP